MTDDEIVKEYALIVAGLSDVDLVALWTAAVLGRRPARKNLVGKVAALNLLRDRVGRVSAAHRFAETRPADR